MVVLSGIQPFLVAMALLGTVLGVSSNHKSLVNKEQFYIRTHVIEGDPSKNDLYMLANPSGDGALLAAFSADKTDWLAYMNGSELMFRYEDPIPYHLYLATAGYEKSWAPTSIHNEQHSHQGKLWFDDNGALQFEEGQHVTPAEGHPFGGWLGWPKTPSSIAESRLTRRSLRVESSKTSTVLPCKNEADATITFHLCDC